MFKNFDLKIEQGDCVALFGPNGIGKTTLLRIIAGLEECESGNISINGKIPSKTSIGYIPQNYSRSLLPWYTVAENITLPLLIAGKTKKMREESLRDIKRNFSVQLPWDNYPTSLSGGQQQLVTIFRSIVNKPDMLLMDEPFSSLDMQTSIEIQEILQKICQEIGLTTVLVSHRINEGLFLSNRILVLKGSPATISLDVINSATYPRKHTIKETELYNKILDKVMDSAIS